MARAIRELLWAQANRTVTPREGKSQRQVVAGRHRGIPEPQRRMAARQGRSRQPPRRVLQRYRPPEARRPARSEPSVSRLRALAPSESTIQRPVAPIGSETPRRTTSRLISAPFGRCALLALHADRDADAHRLLTRRALCSLESFRNLRGGFLPSHTLEKADVLFQPRSPGRRLLRPCNRFSHVLTCLMHL